MSTRIAIIGTAGRKDDGARLTRHVWEQMLADARQQLADIQVIEGADPATTTLVSGGAAYADHLAVKLYREGLAADLELHLPAELSDNGFVEDPARGRMDAGRVANYYHGQFKSRTGVDGLAELRAAAASGARVEVTHGFKERNTKVANSADVLLAYTFGGGREITSAVPGELAYADATAAGLKDGGTADTFGKSRAARLKRHVPIDMIEQQVRERGGRAATEGAQSGPRAGAEPETPALQAAMYFSYGSGKRADVESDSTFDAILAGERTSTTRFDAWRGTDRWRGLRPGQKVRFFADRERKGRAVDVTVQEVREVDLAAMADAQMEAWSRAEGWSVEAGRQYGQKYGAGVQVIYGDPQPVGERAAQRTPDQGQLDLGLAPAAGDTSRFQKGAARPAEAAAPRNAAAYGARDAIRGFDGQYRWLSNFAPVEVTLDGVSYPSVEHAYQAAKTLDPDERARVRALERPGQAKRAGRTLTIRADWDTVKVQVMRDLQQQKYAQEPYRANLLATGEREIYEQNTWGDRFWGVDPQGRGENRMGQLVMETRTAIREREAVARPATQSRETPEETGRRQELARKAQRDRDDATTTPGMTASEREAARASGGEVVGRAEQRLSRQATRSAAAAAQTVNQAAAGVAAGYVAGEAVGEAVAGAVAGEGEETAEKVAMRVADRPAATTSPSEPIAAGAAVASPVVSESAQMSETQQAETGQTQAAAPVSTRQHLERIAGMAVEIATINKNSGLMRAFSGDRELREVQQALVDMNATLTEARLLHGERSAVEPRAVMTRRLEDVAAVTMRVVDEMSEPGIPARLLAADPAGGRAAAMAMESARTAESSLAAFDYTTPNSEEMTLAIERGRTGEGVRQVQRAIFEEVAGESLDFLEKAHTAGANLDGLAQTRAAHHGLLVALDNAGYLLPGESETRTEPLRLQSHDIPGDKLRAIVEAADDFARAIDADSLQGLTFTEVNAAMSPLAVDGLARQANGLKATLQAAGYAQDEVDTSQLGKPVMVDNDMEFSFAYMVRGADEPAGQVSEQQVRDRLFMEFDEEGLMGRVKFVELAAPTRAAAVEAFGQEIDRRGLDREQVVVLGSGNEELGMERFDEIEIALAEGLDPEQPLPSDFRGRSALSPEVAEPMARLLEVGETIGNTAQVDTQNHTQVTFEAGLLKDLKAALRETEESGAYQTLYDITRGNAKAPGLDYESAGFAMQVVDKLRDVAALTKVRRDDEVSSESGDGRQATVSQEALDGYFGAHDNALATGAVVAINALAGRDSTVDLNTLREGRAASGFMSVRDAMGAGRMGAPDKGDDTKALHKPRSEMTYAYYRSLSEKMQRASRAFIMKPGEGHFEGYFSAQGGDQKVAVWRQRRLRDFIRQKTFNADGTPNIAFRSALMSLNLDDKNKKGLLGVRAVVAPTIEEARVIRQESDRLIEEHRVGLEKQQKEFSEKLPKSQASFDRTDVERFVRKAERNGQEIQATLVKRDDQLVLEHPDAPTIRSQSVSGAGVEEMSDGYRLTKVSPKQLREAMEAQPEARDIKLQLEADRLRKVRVEEKQKRGQGIAM
ncbi:hypothetical protein CKO28_13665 [Rhodovibrio sodomensis]|uniref:NADAR domain-containing protein n=1 Tax=Rhodovibrio sodomensis TaxID=1088 RepID=A0ABS1DGI3_9PROT|nr:NADAR family protein [Rhodovibrio sodomensis]MBK1669081.1 hypothetical protein [Rhodovibrio sodomensis]